jgi:hypothetical protein
MLEDEFTAPLYKTVLHRPSETDIFEKYVIGPLPISVSKINQWVSSFTLCIWAVLVWHALPKFDLAQPLSIRHLAVVGITVLFGGLMLYRGKTHEGSHEHVVNKRATRIL